VFAASSLTESFEELGERWESRSEGADVTFNFASSSDLAIQIEQGAPADVFASADPAQMDVLREAGLARNPVDLATNRLVILVPEDNPAGVTRATDLRRPGIKLVLASPEVPAGGYARQAFEALGISAAAERNVVSNEEDVKAVVTKVALGEADAGVAYVTDVTPAVEDEVETISFPPRADVVATYQIAAVYESPNPAGANDFLDVVTSTEGREVLTRHGFGPPAG
jgi:molybdate transport system substrate-binding protein